MIPHALHNLTFVERFYTFALLDSTNDYAKRLKSFPQKGIFVIQADRQQSGKGRQGNSFFSDIQGGLWVSLVIPAGDLQNHFVHNRAVSLAICETLALFFPHSPLKIKWPNDIYWGDRKICGILLENVPARNDILILGFGLNVNLRKEDFPQELSSIATSAFIETGKAISLGQLLREIISCYQRISAEAQAKAHARYVRLLYKTGSAVEIDGIKGILDSVELDGTLLLATTDGIKNVRSGTLRFL
jgi:BirA family transcriptional regulator, biotin operon repressor / biotin---[acetyl-CoA-carboxylase] ligase